MASKTPKLDLETLEYVLSVVEEYKEVYSRTAYALKKCGNEASADRRLKYSNAMNIISGRIEQLIYETNKKSWRN